VRAVLLGAGYGTRLGSLTTTVPKILVEIGGEPLLGRQLRYLAGQGVDEVALNVHHHAVKVQEYLTRVSPPLPVHLFPEEELLGTAGALLPMRALLTEPFVVLYGDVVTDMDLRDLHRSLRGMATLSYYVSAATEGKGLLELDDEGRVTSFVEKPDPPRARGAISAGMYAIHPDLLSRIPTRSDFGYDVWPTLLVNGTLFGYRTDAYVIDIGSLDALRRVEVDIQRGAFAW
jgi:NDP-sugar pyrophosphorylase family protein